MSSAVENSTREELVEKEFEQPVEPVDEETSEILKRLKDEPYLIPKVRAVIEQTNDIQPEDHVPGSGKQPGLKWMEFFRREHGTARERKRGRIILGFWKIRGLGAPLRMLLEYVGAVYTEKAYTDTDHWFRQDKPKLLEKNPLANLPYIQDGDIVVCQSNACLQYLGDRFGLNGDTVDARRLNAQVLCEAYDLRNDVTELLYPHKERCKSREEFKAKIGVHFVKNLKTAYEKLDAVYKMQGGPYLTGRKICTADFHVWELLDQHECYARTLGLPSPIDGHTKLEGFYAAFRQIPQLKSYFKGDQFALECNGGHSWTAQMC